jgi:protein-arginine kinase activator protein McsA
MSADSQQNAVTDRKLRCPECGKAFAPKHHRQRFCTDAEKRSFNDRERIRGRVMVKLAQSWRLGRSTKNPEKKAVASFALSELCALADAYNQEDAAAGRLSALDYTNWMKISGHSPSADRSVT